MNGFFNSLWIGDISHLMEVNYIVLPIISFFFCFQNCWDQEEHLYIVWFKAFKVKTKQNCTCYIFPYREDILCIPFYSFVNVGIKSLNCSRTVHHSNSGEREVLSYVTSALASKMVGSKHTKKALFFPPAFLSITILSQDSGSNPSDGVRMICE